MDWTELNAGERALLADTFLFRGAEERQVCAAVSDWRCRLEKKARGEVIYAPDRFSRCLGVLLEGRVEVSKAELLMSVLAPGDLFGAAALFNDRPDYATTLTARTACRVVLFPQELVEELLEQVPLLARNYIRYLSGRIRFLDGKLAGLLAGGGAQKLARYLLTAGEDCSATALARRLGLSRASLYRAFDALTRAGLIRREGRHVTVLDREGLAAL